MVTGGNRAGRMMNLAVELLTDMIGQMIGLTYHTDLIEAGTPLGASAIATGIVNGMVEAMGVTTMWTTMTDAAVPVSTQEVGTIIWRVGWPS